VVIHVVNSLRSYATHRLSHRQGAHKYLDRHFSSLLVLQATKRRTKYRWLRGTERGAGDISRRAEERTTTIQWRRISIQGSEVDRVCHLNVRYWSLLECSPFTSLIIPVTLGDLTQGDETVVQPSSPPDYHGHIDILRSVRRYRPLSSSLVRKDYPENNRAAPLKPLQ
jgi:hypothetical protein